MKILYVNKKNIHSFVQLTNSENMNYKWDKENKQYYSEYFFKSNSLVDMDSILITFKNTNNDTINIIFPITEKLDIGFNRKPNCSKRTTIVSYINETKTLFIRLPKMAYNRYSFSDSISEIFMNNIVENILIDVRGNSGGNDAVWEDVVSILIGPYKKTERLCGKNSKVFQRYLSYYLNNDSLQLLTDSVTHLLDSSYCCIDLIRELPVQDTSYYFKKNIYILFDDKVFSSTFSFISFMESFNNVITLGKIGGYVKYTGIRPLPFVLPHSKIIFKTPINFDVTSIVNLNDFYSNPEIIIHETPEYFFKYYTIPDIDYYNYNTLKDFDIYFNSFLNLINMNER